MTLEVDVGHRLGALTLQARFTAETGVTALFGDSGAGKTSLVNIIGGLIRPDRGRVVIDGEVLVDTERGIFLPKHKRRLGYVFQEGRLFPHLTVQQNLLYGRWFAPKSERRIALPEVVGLLGLEHLLHRRPGLLSGGEKQRVAIGRALLASPRLILMDEPLASLDEARKLEILPFVERLRDGPRVPIVYVSHSVAEVTRLATTIVVMSDGRVAAAGSTSDIMGRLDLFPLTGRADAGAVLDASVESHDAASQLTVLRSPAGRLRAPRLDLTPGTSLRLRIRARDVMIATKPPEGLSALNVIEAIVAEIAVTEGPVADVRLDCNGATLIARLTRHSIEHLGLQRGLKVYAVIKSVAFDRRSIGGAPHSEI